MLPCPGDQYSQCNHGPTGNILSNVLPLMRKYSRMSQRDWPKVYISKGKGEGMLMQTLAT